MENLIARYENAFRKYSDLPAITEYFGGRTYSYRELAAAIDRNHRLFKEQGIVKGDRIALVGKNSADWVCLYISTITYGATAVPILPDFNPIDITGIIGHCGAVLLFADGKLLEKMDTGSLKELRKTFRIEDLHAPEGDGFDIDGIDYPGMGLEDTAIISYTSGTTGSSKGVMIPLRSLSSNVEFAINEHFHFRGSHVLALLPLAHAYGCAFDMLTPLATGSHIFILGKIPTPNILVEALAKVRPHLICTVPLVMEKLVHRNVMPLLERRPLKTLTRIPLLRNIVFRAIRSRMLKTFGGRIREINMGGAALATDVETFLKRIRFPFTIGYGMTECAPLISYSPWKEFRKGSCGRLFPGMEVKVETEGFGNGLGEICVRGANVMAGYYRNPEATAAALNGGWLHTGDVGYVDKDNFIYLRGRCKSMILTSTGQNIYPEEIESKLNHLDGVSESLVYERDGKLFALVVPDNDMMKESDGDGIRSYMKTLLGKLNSLVAPFEKISDITACSEPFEKTPKQSIKRFLYPKKAKLI